MTRTIVSCSFAIALAILVSGCNEQATYDPSKQAGGEPPLPGAHNFLARRAARQSGDRAARLGVPVRRAEAGEGGHEIEALGGVGGGGKRT